MIVRVKVSLLRKVGLITDIVKPQRHTATTDTKTYSEYVKLMWYAKMRTGESAKDFYDRVVGYKTAAATALNKDLPPTTNQANAVSHLEYLANDAFIEGLSDGWRTSFAAAPTSLEQALSTAQAQERYRVPTGSNTTKICQLLRENLTLTGPTDFAQGAASSILIAKALIAQIRCHVLHRVANLKRVAVRTSAAREDTNPALMKAGTSLAATNIQKETGGKGTASPNSRK